MYKIPEDVKSKYEFVTLAAKRAEQLQAGALPRVESKSNKVTVVAQAEVAAGMIHLYDAQQSQTEAPQVEEE
jgi:DNA-directed RNA polymerase omega subunit